MKTTLLTIALLSGIAASAQENVTREYYADGGVRSEMFVVGERIRSIVYHQNGEVSEKGWFVADKPDGVWKQYDQSGSLLARAQFNEGKREGKWSIRNTADGTMMRLLYRDSKLVHGEQIDENGLLVAVRDNR